jgi:hypothetical protein
LKEIPEDHAAQPSRPLLGRATANRKESFTVKDASPNDRLLREQGSANGSCRFESAGNTAETSEIPAIATMQSRPKGYRRLG